MRNDNVFELLSQIGAPIPCKYPNGEAGNFLINVLNQPLSLLIGAIAMYGTDSPWSFPYILATRLKINCFNMATLAKENEATLGQAIAEKPRLHIDPIKIGKWISQTIKVVVSQYGEVSLIWNSYGTIDIVRLINRLKNIPGIGETKALVFAFLLNRDWGVNVTGWNKNIPMDSPTTIVCHRLGIETFPENPEQIILIYEGIREIAKNYCTSEPQCWVCPLSTECHKLGV